MGADKLLSGQSREKAVFLFFMDLSIVSAIFSSVSAIFTDSFPHAISWRLMVTKFSRFSIKLSNLVASPMRFCRNFLRCSSVGQPIPCSSIEGKDNTDSFSCGRNQPFFMCLQVERFGVIGFRPHQIKDLMGC